MARGKRIIGTDMEMVPALANMVAAASRKGFEVARLETISRDERRNVDVLLLKGSGLVAKKLFDDFPNVRLLQSMSAGVDFINISAIPKDVVLCSNAGAYREPIAEHVFALLLHFTKNLERNHNRLRRGVFDNSPDATFLAGKTLGVIGAGGIGQSVARVAKGFNMRTIGINTSGKSAPNFDEVWPLVRLDELLKGSDFVVVSLPLDMHTRNLIDKARLETMKEDAVLVNVARGPIVSQRDLYFHLKSHPQFRAGIDVWWTYPRKGEKFTLKYPFLELPNFLGSPHVADGVPEANAEGQRHAFENVLRYVSGQALLRVIDKADYEGFTGANH